MSEHSDVIREYLQRELNAARVEIGRLKQDRVVMLYALKAAEPYLYNSPLEGVLDVHEVVRKILEEQERNG